MLRGVQLCPDSLVLKRLRGWFVPRFFAPAFTMAAINLQRKGASIMQRNASAHWSGGLKDGKGTVSSASGVLNNTPYSFATRFESQPGTNPEELIAAAHAGCFTMALSAQLGTAGMTAQAIDTTATVTLEKVDSGFAITTIHLQVKARIPGAD